MSFKQLLVLSVFCLAKPFFVSSQFDFDYLYRTEMTKIILNYDSLTIERFDVKVSRSSDYFYPVYTLYKYRKKNDSILREKYLKRKTDFIIDDKGMTEIDPDVIIEPFYEDNWERKVTDSAGTTISTGQKIVDGDTTMGYSIHTHFDSITNSTIEITNYLPGTDSSLYKSVTTIISDDIRLNKQYQYKEGGWKINYEYLTIKLHSQTENTKTILERTYQISHNNTLDPSELNISNGVIDNDQLVDLNQTDVSERKIITHFDYYGLITKIVIKSNRGDNYFDGKSTIVLRPTVLD